MELLPEFEVMFNEFESEFFPELEFELIPEVTGISRKSAEYIKWVQDSLNHVLGLNLKVDGIMGTKTRSAIRSFQKQNGLKIDGIVGPNTERLLKIVVEDQVASGSSEPVDTPTITVTPAKPCPTLPFKTIIGGYGPNQSSLSKTQQKLVGDIGRMMIEGIGENASCDRISSIDVVGHTDNIGSRSDNFRLGKKRADVITELLNVFLAIATMNEGGPYGSPISNVKINTSSAGPDQPIAPNTTPAERSLNKRVEVILK